MREIDKAFLAATRTAALNSAPPDRSVVILSGGMDSTIAMRLCVERLGPDKVKALSFNYGQRQVIELERAAASTKLLGVEHEIVDLNFISRFGKGFSANIDPSMEMPTIQDVLGDPQPKTYVPNRNMIMLSIAAAYAETHNCKFIVTGLQVHDTYGYWDTTQGFVDSMNSVLSQNRHNKIRIVAPFVDISKTKELKILNVLDGNYDLLQHTITCYNPKDGISCGQCPSCAERIGAFISVGGIDPIPYAIDIDWNR